MIIQCPTCTTRFNVPDEKISGPQVKVRCSKCKNIFPAGEGNSTIAAATNPPAAAAPAQAAPMPSTTPPAPSASPPSASPFGAPRADPFGAPPSPSAAPAAAPAVADPFAAPAPPAGSDPFAPSPTTSGQPTRIDPFGAPAGQPPKKSASTSMDALRQMASAPLPSVSPPGAPPPAARPPSGPFSLPSDSSPNPPAPAGGDPFAAPSPPPGFNAPVNSGAPGGDPFGGPAASMPPQPASAPGPGAAAAPGADPFAAATPPGGDPFASPAGSAPLGSDPFAAAAPPAGADPFAAGGGDPFAAPAGGDPFAGAAGGAQQEALADELFGGGPPGGGPPAIPDDDDGVAGADPFAAAASGGDPFAEPAAGPADDPFAAAAAQSDPFDGGAQGDPFAEVSDAPGEALDDPFADPPGTGVAAETRVHQVSEELREKAKPLPRPKKRRQPLTQRAWFTGGVRGIGRAISLTVHVVLAAGFLLAAILWARGASVADVKEGRALAVVLSGKTAVQSTEGDLRAVGVVVTRRPLQADPGLVVVTGEVENQGNTPVAGVRVEVQFGESGRVYQAWAGHKVDALDLALAQTPEALRALGTTVARADLLPGEKAPFAVLATEVEDGKKAKVRVRRADVPTPTEGS